MRARGGGFDFSGRAEEYRQRNLLIQQTTRGGNDALIVTFGENYAFATSPRLRLAGVNDVAHAL